MSREWSADYCRSTRDFELTVDEPEEMGGSNEGPNPLEYLLAAQAGWLNGTGQQITSDMRIEINEIQFSIESDFNQAAFVGKDEDQTGLQNSEISMSIESTLIRKPSRNGPSASRRAARSPTSRTKPHST